MFNEEIVDVQSGVPCLGHPCLSVAIHERLVESSQRFRLVSLEQAMLYDGAELPIWDPVRAPIP